MHRLIGAVVLLLFVGGANAGEIIGNTYFGEKNGYVEIISPGGKWQIEDQEGSGTNIAKLTLKDPINGTRPVMQFFGVPKQEGTPIPMDQIGQWARETADKNGIALSPTEIKRYSGKPVLFYSGTLTKANQRVVFHWYFAEGPKAFIGVTASANGVAYDSAKRLFEEVMENLKY